MYVPCHEIFVFQYMSYHETIGLTKQHKTEQNFI